MPHGFRSALARTQSDYEFYVGCLTHPDTALAEYDLSTGERAMLTDPDLLAEALGPGGMLRMPTITITISGKHDWVNVAAPKGPDQKTEMIAKAVAAVRNAHGRPALEESALRLIRLVG